MAALTGRTPGAPDNTYQGLLRLENPLSGSLETVIDGLGTATVIQISTTTVAISSLSLGTPLTAANGGTGTAVAFANVVFAGPTSGGAVAPIFRSLVVADIPTLTSAKISDFDAAVTSNSLSDFDPPTGDVTMNGFKLTSLGAPTSSSDAVTKAYVDAIAAGFTPKPGAAVATVEPLPACTYNNGTFGVGATLTGTANGELQIDNSASLVAPMRVLVKDQADAEENGLYVMTQQGTVGQPFILTRHVAMDQSDEIVGALIPVEDEGDVNVNTLWFCTNSTAPTIGTTHITFTQFAVGSVTPGGSDTHVQINDGGVLGGFASLTFDKTTHVLTAGSASNTGTVTVRGSSFTTGFDITLGANGLEIQDQSGDDRFRIFENSTTSLFLDEFAIVAQFGTRRMTFTNDSLPSADDCALTLEPATGTADIYLLAQDCLAFHISKDDGPGDLTDVIQVDWSSTKFIDWAQDGNSLLHNTYYNYSTTTDEVPQVRLTYDWATQTHASRKGRFIVGVYDTTNVRNAIVADAVSGAAAVGINATPNAAFTLTVGGHAGPSASATHTLGTAALRWLTIYGNSESLVSDAAATVPLTIQAHASQSGNLFEIETSGAVDTLVVNAGSDLTLAPTVRTTGSPTHFTLTGAAHTTLTATVEATDINLNLARTVQFSTGTLQTQRAIRVQAPTYAFVAASTITHAVTFDISGAPIVGTNATITNQIALRVGSGVAAGVALQLNAATSQTGDMIQVNNSAGTNIFRVEDDGKINVPMQGSQQTGVGSVNFSTSGSSVGSGGVDSLEFNVASAYFLGMSRAGSLRYMNANGTIYWLTQGNPMLGLAQNYAADKPTGSTYGNCYHVCIGPTANTGFLSNSVLDVAGAITLTQRTTVSATNRPCAIFEPFWNTSADSTRLGAVTVGVYDTTNLRVAIRFDGVSGGSSTTIYGDTTVQPFVRTTGSPTGFLYTGAAHTTLTASTESTDVNLNFARTVQFSTGALTTQRTIRIQAATYAFAGASTLTNAITLHLSGAPVAGTNATITNAIAAMFEAGHQNGVPLVLKGAGSQAKDLFQIQDSSGTVLNNCDKDGYMFPFAMGFNLGVGAPGVTGTNLSCVIQLPCDCKLVDVIAYAKTGPTGADAIFDVNYHATDDASATTIWSTQANRVRIVAGSKTGQSSTFNTSTFAKYGVLTIDWDQIGSTIAGQDVTITLWFRGKEAR